MTGDDAVAPCGVELFALYGRRRRGEDEAVDAADATMDDGKATAGDLDVEPTRQRAHPDPALAVKRAIGMRIPFSGEAIASATLGIAAAAIAGAARKRFLAIPHDRPAAGLADRVERR